MTTRIHFFQAKLEKYFAIKPSFMSSVPFEEIFCTSVSIGRLLMEKKDLKMKCLKLTYKGEGLTFLMADKKQAFGICLRQSVMKLRHHRR